MMSFHIEMLTSAAVHQDKGTGFEFETNGFNPEVVDHGFHCLFLLIEG